MTRPSPAAVGWGGVLAVVVGYDAWALATSHETMSGFFWRHRDDKVSRFVGIGAWAGLTWHLLFGDKVLVPEPVHNYYLRVHPLWALNARLKKRAMNVMVLADDLLVVPPEADQWSVVVSPRKTDFFRRSERRFRIAKKVSG